MRLAKSITPRNIKELEIGQVSTKFLLLSVILIGFNFCATAQDNSPYSRYGIGSIAPSTNIYNRGMAGIVAGYIDQLTINFSNPASYSSFKNYLEQKSKKQVSGRVILDAGINFGSRTLREGSSPEKFTSSDAYFSYIQVGIPLKQNWGLSFGIRPVSRIYYKLNRRELLKDPITQLPIDSAVTEFKGDGGSFLPTIGTGYAYKNFSVGVNVGYLFGRKDFSSKIFLFNDTVSYKNGNYQEKTSFGSLFYSAGIQYKAKLSTLTSLTLGAYGNLQQKLNAKRDIIRETFVRDANGGDITVDSVESQKDVTGTIVYPAQYSVGFTIEKMATLQSAGWLLGIDYIQTKWSNYRIYNVADAVKDNWEIRIGGQYRPAAKKNYFSNIAYRAGFFTGPDYVSVADNNKLNQFGVTLGASLPLANYSRLSGQFTMINLAFEYIKRGNNSNLVKENLFRVSLGLNLSDLWFQKRKYD